MMVYQYSGRLLFKFFPGISTTNHELSCFNTKRCYEKINTYNVVTPGGDMQQLMEQKQITDKQRSQI